MADFNINQDTLKDAELLFVHPEATDEERQGLELALTNYYTTVGNMQPEAVREKLANMRYNEITGYGITDSNVQTDSDIGQIVGGMAGAIAAETTGARVGGAGGAVIGGMLGGPAGAITGQRVGAVTGAVTASAIGAYTGGAAGDLAQQLSSNYMNDGAFNASLNKALQAGGEEAIYDVVGQVLFRGVPAVYRAGKGFLGKGKNENLEEINTILKARDTYPSLDQMTDNIVIKTMGQILRSLPVTNRSFQQLDAAQEEAFDDYFQQQAKQFANLTSKELKQEGFGRVVSSVLKQGESVFDEAMNTAWKQFDDLSDNLYKTKQVDVDVATRSSGRATVRQTVEYAPVNVSAIRKNAKAILDEAEKKIGSVDPSASGIGILRGVANGANNLTFSQTHKLLSDLKRLQRTGRTQGLPSSVVIKDLIGDLDQAFNKAGEAFEDADIVKLYANLRRQTKLGKNRFNADFVDAIIQSGDGTKISKMLMDATPSEINQLRKGIYYADSMAGRATGTSWKKVQSGFLSQYMPTNVGNIDNSPIMKIIKNQDRGQLDKIATVFGKEQADKLQKSFSLLNDLRVKPIFGASIGQSMAVAGTVAGVGVGGIGYAGGMGPAIATVLTPKILSSIFTSKSMSNKFYSLLNQAKKANEFKPVNRANAYVRIARLSNELAQEALREE